MAKTPSILDQYPNYEVVIGIEVHVQLATRSKIFCSCANQITTIPNSNICEICSGQPGVLPVLNREVIHCAILAGLATDSVIAPTCTFDRKHYFYPDLPKNYQITQNYVPICTHGSVPIRLEDGAIKNVKLNRIHIEEDAGKNIHSSTSKETFVDLNRAGTPLLEIVTDPDIESTYQAKAYLKALRAMVQYLYICSGNMEEGAFRADTNISVRKKGQTQLGTKCELKNINSFKFIGDAIEYEIQRQIEMLENGEKILQETRLWDSKNKTTVPMRSKEEAADYRYFEDPDLPLIVIDDELITRIKKLLPELPHKKFDRFTSQLGLTAYEAEILIEDLALANYFEETLKHSSSKQIIHWILRDVMGYLKENNCTLAALKVTPTKLANIVDLIDQGAINSRGAQQLFAHIAKHDGSPQILVKELGLEQIDSTAELEAIIAEIIAQNPKMVEEYKGGKEKLFGFFVGQTMAKTQGKGNPKIIQELLKKLLS